MAKKAVSLDGLVNPEKRRAVNVEEADALEGLNFKVPASFKREYKAFCGKNGLSLVQALRESFELLKDRYD